LRISPLSAEAFPALVRIDPTSLTVRFWCPVWTFSKLQTSMSLLLFACRCWNPVRLFNWGGLTSYKLSTKSNVHSKKNTRREICSDIRMNFNSLLSPWARGVAVDINRTLKCESPFSDWSSM
jgi:hypothetical protein